jgi:hypothetical protein
MKRLVLGVALVAAMLAAPPAGAATFAVTNTANSGAGSFARAITDSNTTAGKDTITFNIPGAGVHVITPAPKLPTVTDPVVLDATTQPGYAGLPLIQLMGTGQIQPGLDVNAGGTTVRGFDLTGWQEGIELRALGQNLIVANFIGTDPTGRVASPNYNGITINGSNSNKIGGKTSADRNVISGNVYDGIYIGNVVNGMQQPVTENNNQVLGNYIGVSIVGGALPNAEGIAIQDVAGGNIIGTSDGGGNVISGNLVSGIFIVGDADPSQQPINTHIAGNKIGVNAGGSARIQNGGSGILVVHAQRTSIGGVPLGSGNVISGNHIDGIENYASIYTTIAGNDIGTDAGETGAIPNGDDGVRVEAGSGYVRVGGYIANGTIYGAPNLISGNGQSGVEITDSSSNWVFSNTIGLNGAKTYAIGNGANGVKIAAPDIPAQNNKVGQPNAGNTIAGNGQSGVLIYRAAATYNDVVDNIITDNGLIGINMPSGQTNRFAQNSIFANGGLGIDLGGNGVTFNDAGDADGGPNTLLNFPTLGSSGIVNNQLTINGTYQGAPSEALTLEFFANHACDPQGYGDGETYLGSKGIATNLLGQANYSVTFPVPYSNPRLTATATDNGGNTSEFSACVVAG